MIPLAFLRVESSLLDGNSLSFDSPLTRVITPAKRFQVDYPLFAFPSLPPSSRSRSIVLFKRLCNHHPLSLLSITPSSLFFNLYSFIVDPDIYFDTPYTDLQHRQCSSYQPSHSSTPHGHRSPRLVSLHIFHRVVYPPLPSSSEHQHDLQTRPHTLTCSSPQWSHQPLGAKLLPSRLTGQPDVHVTSVVP